MILGDFVNEKKNVILNVNGDIYDRQAPIEVRVSYEITNRYCFTFNSL